MSEAEKTKPPERKTALDRIATQLRALLRGETKNVIEIGKLLIESREHLQHGEWLPWLAENFALSDRTALNYMNAAEYVARKSETVSDFANLSPSVLYWLAAGNCNEQEEAAILAATREGRVDQDAAAAICAALALADDDDAEDADNEDADDEDGSGEGGGQDGDPKENAEIEAILDGPPPEVPPPAPNLAPPDYALRDFDDAISALKRLMTKPLAQFAKTTHTANDLEGVECFIRTVAKATFSELDGGGR
jgi:DUF3102 family protein